MDAFLYDGVILHGPLCRQQLELYVYITGGTAQVDTLFPDTLFAASFSCHFSLDLSVM